MRDVTFSDVIEAEALGRKFGESYRTADAIDALVYSMIPNREGDQVRLRSAIRTGIRNVVRNPEDLALLNMTLDKEYHRLLEKMS